MTAKAVEDASATWSVRNGIALLDFRFVRINSTIQCRPNHPHLPRPRTPLENQMYALPTFALTPPASTATIIARRGSRTVSMDFSRRCLGFSRRSDGFSPHWNSTVMAAVFTTLLLFVVLVHVAASWKRWDVVDPRQRRGRGAVVGDGRAAVHRSGRLAWRLFSPMSLTPASNGESQRTAQALRRLLREERPIRLIVSYAFCPFQGGPAPNSSGTRPSLDKDIPPSTPWSGIHGRGV